MKDTEKVLDICRRIERVLQRDWGGSGEGLRNKLRSAQYAVPADLRKRIRYLHGLQKKALKTERFKLKSSEDFLAKGEQVIKELALARKTAKRRLLPWLRQLAVRYRIILAVAAVALVAALAGLFFIVFQPEPPPPPPVPTPAPKRVPKPAPKHAAAPTPAAAPAPVVPASAPVPAASAPAPAASAASAEPAPIPAGVKVHIETPPEVIVTLKRAEVVQGASGRDEIAVIVDVQNVGYASLKRITFDAWLYDTKGSQPLPVILASSADATPWHAFLRQDIQRGQRAEVRLNYNAASRWSSEQAVALVNSGRYQIRLKAVSLTDGADRPLAK